jgi:predicted  nucleic acid-binding Zn-ribbon protein
MDWLKELLKNSGIADDLIENIVANVTKEAANHVVPKAQYNELTTAKSSLETQLSERDTQLADLQKQVKGNEELEATIKQLQADNQATTEKHAADMKIQKIESAIDLALANAKVLNEQVGIAAKSLINRENLVVDDKGEVVGLKEQIESLKTGEATKVFFESTEVTIAGAQPGGQGSSGGGQGQQVDTSKMTYSELTTYLAQNPDVQL